MTKTLSDEIREENQHQQWLIENGKLYNAAISRAEAAEARAAQLQFDLNEAQINIKVMAEYNTKISAERDAETNRADMYSGIIETLAKEKAQAEKSFNDTLADIKAMMQERDTLQTDNDIAMKIINTVRNLVKAGETEMVTNAVKRVVSERDELRRQLEQAQNRERMDRAVMTEASAKIEEFRQQLEQVQGESDQRLEMLYSMRGFLYGCGYTGAAIEAYLSALDKEFEAQP